ncbi:hypothetical protein HBI56_016530 [Parastagonospora nodorum]|uniref:Uncharacterized protein n=1 Tax=Phaeosphaeria nodorum (strain SN15 / ATCC MYA-4574 / FGSC 10173) TaxID=321614 RepID=A0A7U2F1H4_PHANO|nr:hypothetical protein HBH56_083460 [Parastagonospora nodorum]QRC96741.1 hypothetical protein JI435_409590 [Parastagonospora nodorum SN15]KAH3929807.1 hypothetical protein HBH54_118360 [Parastagonospora nodorum]KAH3955285.1 hypothetical protein HBH53_006190 [Parastagonospora nodorum]KAH3977082.1 hypothetical protein HBH51_075310 [Parastagonospora nodorum]
MPLFAQFPFIYDDDELMENTLSIKHSLVSSSIHPQKYAKQESNVPFQAPT